MQRIQRGVIGTLALHLLPQKLRQIVSPPFRMFLVAVIGEKTVIFTLPHKFPPKNDTCQFHLHFSNQSKSSHTATSNFKAVEKCNQTLRLEDEKGNICDKP